MLIEYTIKFVAGGVTVAQRIEPDRAAAQSRDQRRLLDRRGVPAVKDARGRLLAVGSEEEMKLTEDVVPVFDDPRTGIGGGELEGIGPGGEPVNISPGGSLTLVFGPVVVNTPTEDGTGGGEIEGIGPGGEPENIGTGGERVRAAKKKVPRRKK